MGTAAVDVCQEYIRWAEDVKGVVLDGIEPRRLRGCGVGMVATRKLKPGDVILTVPYAAIRSQHSISSTLLDKLPQDVTIQCMLAAELAFDMAQSPMTPWKAVLPSYASLQNSMPLYWPLELQKRLPARAKQLLEEQHARFDRDWKACQDLFSSTGRHFYEHAWLLVNTRSFYFETPEMKKFPWDDRLALLPMADLFNHAHEGCKVEFSLDAGYEFTVRQEYNHGQEVFISYGNHSNDYLLAEYGFLMDNNQRDKVCLDEWVLPMLSREQKAGLQKDGSLGGYMLHKTRPCCPKTLSVLEILVLPNTTGPCDGDKRPLLDMAKYCRVKVNDLMKETEALEVGNCTQRESLLRRWSEIDEVLQQILNA